MYTTYILFSEQADRYYIGCTSDLTARIQKHNYKNKGFTNQASDWKVVFERNFDSKSDALALEKKIKSWKSKLMNQKLISSAGSEHSDAQRSGGSGVRTPHPDPLHFSGVNSPTQKPHRNVRLFF